MTSLNHTRLLAFLLVLAGLGIFSYKAVQLNYPLEPGVQVTVWDYELYLDFEAQNRPVRIEAFIPASGPNGQVAEEQFYNGPFGLRLDTEGTTGNRKAIWTYRYPNERKVLRYRATLLGETADTALPDTMRQKRRRATPAIESDLERQAFIVWSSDLRRRSADDESLAELTLQEIFRSDGVDEVEALLPRLAEPLNRLELARAVFESQGIPARVANGVYLDDARRRSESRHWLEYHVAGEDKRFFPDGTPERFVGIWYGLDPMVTAEGIDRLDIQIGLQPALLSASDALIRGGPASGNLTDWMDFERLPITTQLVYRVLLTIPVGILILVFLRQFVGVETLGTFMPVLIGIAFRETALVNGIVLFSLLIMLGLAMRFYLERLRLLLVPRLAVVLVFIVICMALVTLLLEGTGQRIGLSISLFPMVILTMTIERMSIVWEEYSPSDAIKAGIGSLAVASLTYLVMTHPYVEFFMFNFPELLLVIMGLCLLMGKYTGLRLSEIIRFRQLAQRS